MTLKTIEAILPSGKQIKLREPRGVDEMHAAGDSESAPESYRGAISTQSLMMRCTLELEGKPLDQQTVTACGYRDLFDTKDWMKARDLWFTAFFAVSAAEERSFEDSKRVGTV